MPNSDPVSEMLKHPHQEFFLIADVSLKQNRYTVLFSFLLREST